MRLSFIPLVLVLALPTNAQAPDSPVERRIRLVEQGPRGSYGDPPWRKMQLADCMAHHDVPGVSIAFINDCQLEWTKGYGVLEAGYHQVKFEGSGLASGVYFYRLTAGPFVQTKKLLIVDSIQR